MGSDSSASPAHSFTRLFGRELSVAFLGHFLAKGLGILTFLLITNTLTVAEFGAFSLAMAVFEIALFLSELGLDTGVTRFVAKGLRRQDDASVERVLKAVFVTKVCMSLFILSAGFALAPFVTRSLLDQPPEMAGFLRIAFVGIIGTHLQNFYLAYFGARLQFGHAATLSAISPLAILLAVISCWYGGWLDVRTCLLIYALGPVVVSGVGVALLPHRFLYRKDATVRSLLGVWRFSRWIYATNVCGSLRFRLNSIMLANFATLVDVGLYNYADKLAATVTLFTSTILTVFVPRASHMVTHDELRKLLRLSYRYMGYLLPMLVAVPFISRPFISIVGPDYIDAAPVFSILFASVLFSLFALPSRTVLYSVDRPQVETAVEITALVVTATISLQLVQSHGAMGAAVAMLIQRILSSALVLGWVYHRVYRSSGDGVDADGLAHAPVD